ncbi:MAG: serine hydrolase, partial [Bacteroidia bacterium]
MSVTHTSILFRLLLLLGLSLVLGSLSAQPVDNERSQANPTTDYKWFHNKSANEVNAIAGNTFRLIDIVVVDKSPFRFSGVMVRNSGVHHKPWGWFYGLTVEQMSDTCDKYNMRPLDVEVYRDGNQKRVAFVLVDNSGGQGVAWHFYSDRTLQYLLDKCDEKTMRLTDLDTYTVNGQRNYSGLMIRNTGDNYKAWWVYNNRTGAQLLADANSHNAIIVDLERKDDNNYVAVMERSSDPDFREQGVLWRGERIENLTEVARHFGARITDIEPYMKDGQRYFDLVMLDNVNPLTTRVGNILRNNTDGNIAPYSDTRADRGYTVGFRLEEVNGSTLAALQSDRKFYPASTIKIMEYWYIYRTLLQNDPDPANTLLNTNWNMCRQGTVNCSNNSNTSVGCDSSVSMRNLLRTMMFNSNNQSTNAIQDYAGNGNPSTGRNL